MLLGWIIRVLVVVLLVRALWNFAKGLVAGVAEPPRRTGQAGRPSMPLVRDPVCGTYVDPARAVTATFGRTVHHFCSERCREAFAAGTD